MTTRTTQDILARATARLIEQTDVADALAALLADCLTALGADAAGLLVGEPPGPLELLSATSHRATELELYQLQNATGPCVEAVTRAEHVTVGSPRDIVDRWPPVGQAILDAGFQTVHAFPLRWHDHVVGALNVFFRRAGAEDLGSDLATGRVMANIATLILVQPTAHDLAALRSRVTEALSGRLVIEQAKGVLAYREGLDMGAAYDRLVTLATLDGSGLTAAARQVVAAAVRRS